MIGILLGVLVIYRGRHAVGELPPNSGVPEAEPALDGGARDSSEDDDPLASRKRCTRLIDFIFLFTIASIICVIVFSREFDGRLDKLTDWIARYLPREVALLRKLLS